MEKALNSLLEDMNRKRVAINSNVLLGNVLSLNEDFRKESTEEDSMLFLQQVRNGCVDSDII